MLLRRKKAPHTPHATPLCPRLAVVRKPSLQLVFIPPISGSDAGKVGKPMWVWVWACNRGCRCGYKYGRLTDSQQIDNITCYGAHTNGCPFCFTVVENCVEEVSERRNTAGHGF